MNSTGVVLELNFWWCYTVDELNRKPGLSYLMFHLALFPLLSSNDLNVTAYINEKLCDQSLWLWHKNVNVNVFFFIRRMLWLFWCELKGTEESDLDFIQLKIFLFYFSNVLVCSQMSAEYLSTVLKCCWFTVVLLGWCVAFIIYTLGNKISFLL